MTRSRSGSSNTHIVAICAPEILSPPGSTNHQPNHCPSTLRPFTPSPSLLTTTYRWLWFVGALSHRRSPVCHAASRRATRINDNVWRGRDLTGGACRFRWKQPGFCDMFGGEMSKFGVQGSLFPVQRIHECIELSRVVDLQPLNTNPLEPIRRHDATAPSRLNHPQRLTYAVKNRSLSSCHSLLVPEETMPNQRGPFQLSVISFLPTREERAQQCFGQFARKS